MLRIQFYIGIVFADVLGKGEVKISIQCVLGEVQSEHGVGGLYVLSILNVESLLCKG